MKTPRTGSTWAFEAAGFDVFHRMAHTPEDGTLVRVVQPSGCPKNGTMGQCYVERADNGEFIGMVSIASLKNKKAQ